MTGPTGPTGANALALVPGADLTNADATIAVAGGSSYTLPAATLSANRTITISTTGLGTGEVMQIIRRDLTANTLAIVNGGAGAGTMYTFPGDGVTRAALFIFDGTNVSFAESGRVV